MTSGSVFDITRCVLTSTGAKDGPVLFVKMIVFLFHTKTVLITVGYIDWFISRACHFK